MSPLALVKDTRNPEVLRIIEGGSYTLTDLENRFGISQYKLKKLYGAESRGRGRPKQPKPAEVTSLETNEINILEPKPSSEVTTPPLQSKPRSDPEPKVARPRGMIPLALAVGAIGVGLSISSAALDWSFCRTLSQDPVNSYIFGGIGVLSGAATGLTPSVAFGLRIVGQRGFAILLGIAAVLFFMSSLIVSISFSSTNIGNAIAANGKIEDKTAYVNSAFAAKYVARQQIKMTDDAAVLAQRVSIARGNVSISRLRASNDCKDADESYYPCREMIQLRTAEKEARRRDRLDAELAELQRQKDELPANSGKDPGAVNVSRALLSLVAPEQVSFARSIQFGILANMGCLLLAAAMALFRRP